MKKNSFFLSIIAFVLATSACSLFSNLGSSQSDEIVFVQADGGWQNTGISIEAGDYLTITYLSDRWSPWPGEEFDAIGSGGDPRCNCNVMEGVSHAALIGRIGDNDPFLVGELYQHLIGETGVLYLGINDTDLYDNSGSLQVLIEVD